jgi:hypothetical protein
MDMNPNCQPPVHAEIREADRAHARFNDYLNYRAAMTRQLVYCQPFDSWLRQTEEHEQGKEVVFQVTSPEAALQLGWYKNKFAAKKLMPRTFGPYATETEARAA